MGVLQISDKLSVVSESVGCESAVPGSDGSGVKNGQSRLLRVLGSDSKSSPGMETATSV